MLPNIEQTSLFVQSAKVLFKSWTAEDYENVHERFPGWPEYFYTLASKNTHEELMKGVWSAIQASIVCNKDNELSVLLNEEECEMLMMVCHIIDVNYPEHRIMTFGDYTLECWYSEEMFGEWPCDATTFIRVVNLKEEISALFTEDTHHDTQCAIKRND
jgi:hypothetical protein